jgi:hypothetical protein
MLVYRQTNEAKHCLLAIPADCGSILVLISSSYSVFVKLRLLLVMCDLLNVRASYRHKYNYGLAPSTLVVANRVTHCLYVVRVRSTCTLYTCNEET